MPDHGPTEIGILVYPGAQQAAILGLTDLLLVANRMAAAKQPDTPPRLRVSHWEHCSAQDDLHRIFDSGDGNCQSPQVLVLPPSLEPPIQRDIARAFVSPLLTIYRQGTTLASVCGGGLILAETGLLDGRMATTHWSYVDVIRHRFPAIIPDTDRLIIDDGDIITAGGVMAWTDLGLKLVARWLGPTIMMDTARLLLIDPPGREQRFYSVFAPNLTHGDQAILKLQHWLQASGGRDADLASLAKVAGLEQRTLVRRFRKATGWTTGAYIQRMRVSKAQDLLQFGTQTVDQVAWATGYGDSGAFRRIFHRIVGLTPVEYRRRFSS